jgi:DNA-binding CsgD family transcriptional regulator
MRRTILLYGLVAGALVAVLQLVEYRYLLVEQALVIYGGIVALLFSAFGIWLGLRLTRPRETVIVREVPVPVPAPVVDAAPIVPPAVDAARLERLGITRLGITPREHEVLRLIAAGLSNREIAERLFVSENTVKTHASRLLDKLNARRRTEAVQLAKEAGLLA